MSLFNQGARYTYIEGGLKQRYWVRTYAAKVCTLCIIQNVEGKDGMRMGNSMKPAGAKACAFRGRVATFNEEKETEKARWFSVAVSWLRRRLFGWGSINFSSY